MIRVLSLLAVAGLLLAAPAGAHTVETFATLPAAFEDIALAPDGSLYVPSRPGGDVAWRIELDGTWTTVASGLEFPLGGVVDSQGNYHVSCYDANLVRRIEPDGTNTVFESAIATPTGTHLSADEQTLYVASYLPGRILEIDLTTGVRNVLANGPTILGPDGLAQDEAGNLYVANFVTPQITRVTPDGVETLLTTLPGSQTGYIDYRDGFLYVAGLDTHKIYRVSVADGSFETLAGSGIQGTLDGPAEQARLSQPNGLALSADGLTVWFQTGRLLRRVLLDGPTAAPERPSQVALLSAGAFPNPFVDSTRLEWSLARPSSATIAVYDLAGRRVRDLGTGDFAAGRSTLSWDGRDESGRRVASGVYFVRVDTAGESRTQRVTRVR